MTDRTQPVYFPSPPSFLPLILLGFGFSLVSGFLEIDLWQVHQRVNQITHTDAILTVTLDGDGTSCG